MSENLDLLGDPIPANWGGRGRPAHIPTVENRNKVRVLLAFGWTNKAIAAALRITANTLRVHYFIELRQRDEARPALKAASLMAITRAALADGNVTAMKELQRLIEKDEIDRAPPRPRREAPLGKKAAADAEAQDAHQETEWATLLN